MEHLDLNKYGIKEDDPILLILEKNREDLKQSINEVSKKFISEFSFLKDMETKFLEKSTVESMVTFLKTEVDFIESQRKSIKTLKRVLIILISTCIFSMSVAFFILNSNYKIVSVKKHSDGSVSYSLNNFLGSKCLEVGDGLEVHGRSR